MSDAERTLAVFIDFENLALGFKDKKEKRFEIQKVLERLVEKGKIIVKKAYADWAEYADYKKSLHEAAIDLIEIPKRSMSGKNSRTSASASMPLTSVTPKSTSTPSSLSPVTVISLPWSPN